MTGPWKSTYGWWPVGPREAPPARSLPTQLADATKEAGRMTPKDVLKMAKEKGVKIVDLRFIDLPGLWQHFSIPVSELSEDIFEDGLGFDGSSIRGFQTIDESDMLLIPDPSTAQMDPFTAVPTLVLICNVKDPITGKAYSATPATWPRRPRPTSRRAGVGDTDLHRARARVLLLRLDPLRPELQLRLLLHRLRGGRLEHAAGGHARSPEPRLQAALQAGLLPGAARWTSSRTSGPTWCWRSSRSASASRCTTTRWPPAARPRSTCASTR